MALRLMQIYLPEADSKNIEEILDGQKVLGRWRDDEDGRVVLHLLVPAEETEPITDRFEQAYSNVEGFYAILLPVEAALPRPEDEPEEAEGPIPPEKTEKNRDRISRDELYDEVTDTLGISYVYLGMIFLSAVVAAVGLLRDDVAVIIGAMVIAPLLGPNVAMSLGTTLGDMPLVRRAAATNLAGITLAFAFAFLVGLVFTVDVELPAIRSRTNVGFGDIVLALAAGSAGTLAYTRGLAGAVIGVMVAVALIPPLIVCGMLFGAGHVAAALGALLLTSANLVCINLAGVAVFLLQGVRPRSWWEAERAKKATYKAIVLWVVLLAVLVLIFFLNENL